MSEFFVNYPDPLRHEGPVKGWEVDAPTLHPKGEQSIIIHQNQAPEGPDDDGGASMPTDFDPFAIENYPVDPSETTPMFDVVSNDYEFSNKLRAFDTAMAELKAMIGDLSVAAVVETSQPTPVAEVTEPAKEELATVTNLEDYKANRQKRIHRLVGRAAVLTLALVTAASIKTVNDAYEGVAPAPSTIAANIAPTPTATAEAIPAPVITPTVMPQQDSVNYKYLVDWAADTVGPDKAMSELYAAAQLAKQNGERVVEHQAANGGIYFEVDATQYGGEKHETRTDKLVKFFKRFVQFEVNP